MAKTDDRTSTAEIRAVGNRAVEAAGEVADKGRHLARDVAETTASVAEQTAAHSAAATEQVAGQASRLAAVTPEVVNDITRFWRNLVEAQSAHNVDAFRRLAAARDWQERFDIQSSYLSGNLARMGEAAFRYAELTGTMMSRLLVSGSRQTKNGG
jgi:hypothetical protein